MTSLSLSVLALSLLTGAEARALSKQSITWNACAELNKNISETVAPFSTFECGTIDVPLDYTEDDSPPLALNLFRVKATKEPVLGSVLFNPGGPGGSGSDLPVLASDLRANIGEQYDLVSWDPRGTGYTIPFNCSVETEGPEPSPATKRDVERLGSINVTEYFLAGGWDEYGLMAESCVAGNNETGSLIGTAFTARDMLAIVDALGEDGMLRYYGISYGTVLGSYFAVMFPDRIERMVLDANLDPADYANGTWGDSAVQWDEVFGLFLESCFENKDECALATILNANSTQDLFDAVNLPVEQWVTALTANSSDLTPLVPYATLRGEIHDKLYWPARWPDLAEYIVTFLNATTEEDLAALAPADNSTWSYGEAVRAIDGIRGADATWKPSSAEEYLPVVEYQANITSIADLWYSYAWMAAQWRMPAKEQLEGPFEAKTKNPILYVNGDYDPVTPLAAARRASKGFEGSVVLAHGGYGHSVLAMPSTCVQKHVRAYFHDGTLPEDDTHCESDLQPWQLAKARGGLTFGALNTTSTDS